MLFVGLAALALASLPAATATPQETAQTAQPAEAAETAPSPAPIRPFVTLDLSLGLGHGDSAARSSPQVNAGLHATVRPGPVILAGNVEGALNWVESIHTFATVGVGGSLAMPRGRLALLGLYGVHALQVVDFVGPLEGHTFKVMGARAAWEFDTGRWILPRAALGVSSYFDLEREHDISVDRQVGGTTVLVSLALGLGVGW